MCLMAVAWRSSPQFPLVLAANRDEFYDRPSAPANWWPDSQHVLGGLDLRAGGSWLAVDKSGRLAAVTNVRGDAANPGELLSRGHIVRDFLAAELNTAAYLAQLAPRASRYGPFNLIIGDGQSLQYFSNSGAAGSDLAPGVYGLSNAALDTPWPKVTKLKRALKQSIKELDPAPGLFEVLADRSVAADQQLPDTGVGIELERRLSAPFIGTGDYGTRCSTVIVQGSDGSVRFAERRFDAAGEQVGGSEFSFQLS